MTTFYCCYRDEPTTEQCTCCEPSDLAVGARSVYIVLFGCWRDAISRIVRKGREDKSVNGCIQGLVLSEGLLFASLWRKGVCVFRDDLSFVRMHLIASFGFDADGPLIVHRGKLHLSVVSEIGTTFLLTLSGIHGPSPQKCYVFAVCDAIQSLAANEEELYVLVALQDGRNVMRVYVVGDGTPLRDFHMPWLEGPRQLVLVPTGQLVVSSLGPVSEALLLTWTRPDSWFLEHMHQTSCRRLTTLKLDPSGKELVLLTASQSLLNVALS